MDRLLSEGEIMATTGCFGISENYQKLIKAQLAKTDKEWMEWLLGNLFRETDYGLEWQSTPRIALRLAERKLEIGI